MRSFAWGAGLALGVLIGQATAQAGDDAPSIAILDRETLLDGADGPKQALRARGIIVDGSLTQFYQGVVSGDGNKAWQYGGKGDLIVTLDGHKLGLWQGFYVNVHQEWVYGEDANSQGDGSVFPVNTALGLPPLGGSDRDTSVTVTQNFGRGLTVSAGKFNLLDAAAKTPLMGGGGLETFLNVALAAPISGVTPPYIVGAIATLKTEPAIFTLMVYDPRNAQSWDVIEHPFADGTTISLGMTVPTKFAGLNGYYGMRGIYSSKSGLDLANIPQLIIPSQGDEILSKDGYWYLGWTVQQYLYQDSRNPAVGWGFFSDIGISDGNPNPFAWHVVAGIGGNNTAPGRQQDRWGIAYFKYGWSNDLLAGLKQIGLTYADESGVADILA